MTLVAALDTSQTAANQREAAWVAGIQRFFPGVDFIERPSGSIEASARGAKLGPAHLWVMASPPQKIRMRNDRESETRGFFTIVLQVHGSMTLKQAGRVCRVDAGGMTVADGHMPIDAEFPEANTQILLHIPRAIVIDRYPYMDSRTAILIPPGDVGAAFLRSTLENAAEMMDRLSEAQANCVFMSVLQLMGAPETLSAPQSSGNAWRVNRALVDVEYNFRSPSFDAEAAAAAQHISRRRLDAIMIAETGQSLTQHIRERRLVQASQDLVSQAHRSAPVSEIAFATGFEQTAHFCRSFKSRFGTTPSAWRASVGRRSDD